MSSKRKEYHVDHHAAKAAKFFLVYEGHIDPDMRVKILAAMMAKRYSNKESKNRMLQMQVNGEVKKIRGLDPPPLPRQWLRPQRQGDAVMVLGSIPLLQLRLLFLSAMLTPRFNCLDNILSNLGLGNANLLRKGWRGKSLNRSPLYKNAAINPRMNLVTDKGKR
jgi:hypothetical protein